MANSKKVRDSLKAFFNKMMAYDADLPEEFAEDALEVAEEVSDALCEDETADPLDITKDKKEKDEEELEARVTDGVLRALRQCGIIKDKAMESLDELKIEEKECEDEDIIVEDGDEESVTVDPETMKDSAAVLRMLKPMVASIKNPRDRKKAADALARLLKMSTSTTSDYGNIMKMAKCNSKDAAIKMQDDDMEFGKKIAQQYNPHYKKEDK